MGALAGRLKVLRDAGLTGQMVARDFVQRRIAPLQDHVRPMWMYSGPQDRMRLHGEPLPEKETAAAMKLLFGVAEIPGADMELLRPIHQLPLQSRLDILESLPTFNARGLEGESGVDAAPVVEDDDVAQYLADSEVEEETEDATASASAEESSSPWAERAEAVVEVSSGEEEFVVAPSSRIMEGGEEKEEEEDQAADLERSGVRAAPRRSTRSQRGAPPAPR